MASYSPSSSPSPVLRTPEQSSVRGQETLRAAPPTWKKSSGSRLVIAIDFGSYASGYAWQFRTDFERDRLDIHVNTKWFEGGIICYKTLTALLLKSSLDANTTVEDANGRHLPASLVFGKSIQFMKDHAIKHLQETGLANIEEDTKWVITIPAIWTDRSKGLMRKAATEVAGIPAENLTIALEPECAAIYCSQLTLQQLEIDGDGGKLQYIAAPGSVLMLVDMGGGTIDVTTVRVSERGHMEHVQMSGGGPWGGMRIDEKFFMMLRDLIGQEVFKEFVKDNKMDYFDLQMEFEAQKRLVKHPSDPDSKQRFQLKFLSC
ncbi:heat shock 70 kDa protein 12B-like isoform X2 [Dreissena polymorpha]|nr:heat shock 70 kDa protein 12B-like isoform X2 [Dreissena polymorpha]